MRENTPNMVGVDIAKSHLDAHRLRTGEAARFGNDAAGFEELAGWIGAADRVVRVVYEATGRCHRAFEEALAGAGLPLARANPLRAALRAVDGAQREDGRGGRRGSGADGRRAGAAADGAAGRGAARPWGFDGGAGGAGAGPGGGAEPPEGPARGAAPAAVPAAAGAERAAAQGRGRGDRADAGLHSGRGKATAAGLLAAMPEPGGLDAKAAASLAGLAPVARESGQWRGRRFIQGGRARARRPLHMAAVAATRHNPDLDRKYRDLIGRGKPPKVALVAVMRKLLLLANALLRQNRLWTPRAGDEPAAAPPPRAADRHTAPATRFQPRPDTPNTGARANLEGWMHTQSQNQHLQHGYSFRYWNRLRLLVCGLAGSVPFKAVAPRGKSVACDGSAAHEFRKTTWETERCEMEGIEAVRDGFPRPRRAGVQRLAGGPAQGREAARHARRAVASSARSP